jgi:hypothetical protein
VRKELLNKMLASQLLSRRSNWKKNSDLPTPPIMSSARWAAKFQFVIACASTRRKRWW